MQKENRTVRLRVSPQVAQIVTPGAPRDRQLAAARGELAMAGLDLVTALLFLVSGGDQEVRGHALATLKSVPAADLAAVLADSALPPQILDFLARLRGEDEKVLQALLAHPSLAAVTLARIAAAAAPDLLPLIGRHPLAAAPEVVTALAARPAPDLSTSCGGQAISHEEEATAAAAGEDEVKGGEVEGEAEETGAEPEDEAEEPAEEVNPSKYKLSLEMEVAEKIKYAMTGDKEWRTIFIRDANKLVSAAVLKNPRITEAEVLTIAKNKSTNEELIRLIVANREWVKNSALRKTLVMHPKTPLPKALRFMEALGLKDLKALAKSRNVSPALANNARRLVMAREKKR